MSTLRLEARVSARSHRARRVVVELFDLQLAIYALALVIIGLLMAFTNSAGTPLEAGSLFTRGLMWLRHRHHRVHRLGGRRLPLARARSRGPSTSSTSACSV